MSQPNHNLPDVSRPDGRARALAQFDDWSTDDVDRMLAEISGSSQPRFGSGNRDALRRLLQQTPGPASPDPSAKSGPSGPVSTRASHKPSSNGVAGNATPAPKPGSLLQKLAGAKVAAQQLKENSVRKNGVVGAAAEEMAAGRDTATAGGVRQLQEGDAVAGTATQEQVATTQEQAAELKREQEKQAKHKAYTEELTVTSEETLQVESQLASLERELHTKMEQAQRAREKALTCRQVDLENFEKEASMKLARLTQEGEEHREQRHVLALEMEKLSQKIKQDKEAKAALDAQDLGLDERADFEAMQASKMELDEIAQWRASLQEAMDAHTLHLQVLQEEKEAREFGSVETLNKAMAHAEALKQEVESGRHSKASKIRFVEWLRIAARSDQASNDEKASVGQYSMIDEIMEKRRSERMQDCFENERALQELNNQRFDMMQAQTKLRQHAYEQRELHKKGLSALVEMELGNAPPVEYILRNMMANPEIEPPAAPAAEVPLPAVLERVQGEGDVAERRAQIYSKGGLADEMKKNLRAVAKYDGSLGPSSYSKAQAHSVAVVSAILRDVVRNALNSIPAPPLLETVERERRQNERETEQLLRDAEVSMRDHALAGIRDSVLHEVVNEAIEEVYLEALEARQLISNLLSSAIVKRVITIRETLPNEQPQIKQTYVELQRQRRLHGTKAKSRFVVRMDTPLDPDRPAAPPEDQMQGKWVPDFPPNPEMMMDPNRKGRHGNVSVLVASQCGRLLAAGSEKGLVVVWSISTTGAQRLRCGTSTLPGRVTKIAFGHDSLKLAVLMSKDGSVWAEIYSLNHVDPMQPLSRDGDFLVPELVLLTVVTPSDLRRPARGGDLPDLSRNLDLAAGLCAQSVWWHPSWSMLGTSESFLLGLQDGSIVKCNPENKVQAAPVGPHGFGMASKPNPRVGDSRIECEFFLGHTEPVVFLGALVSEDLVSTIVSVDSTGLILQWRYEPGQFTGFGSFGPAVKSRLNMSSAIRGEPATLTSAALRIVSSSVIMCLLNGVAAGNAGVGALAAISIDVHDELNPLLHKTELTTVPSEPVTMALAVVNGADFVFLASYSGLHLYSAENCAKLHTISPPWLMGPPLPMIGNKEITIAACSVGTLAVATHFTDQVYTVSL